jgi:two-component system chemotaxis response regulator CheY
MLSASIRVLVVDDMSTMRKYVKQCLAGLGVVNVVEADDGDSAWTEVLRGLEGNNPVQLIITDWNMPRVAGIDFLRMVRSDERTCAVPVLMVTAEGKQEQIIEAIQAGVSAYLVKPFSPDGLEDRLKLALRV